MKRRKNVEGMNNYIQLYSTELYYILLPHERNRELNWERKIIYMERF
jgi:hypothetical protein